MSYPALLKSTNTSKIMNDFKDNCKYLKGLFYITLAFRVTMRNGKWSFALVETKGSKLSCLHIINNLSCPCSQQ